MIPLCILSVQINADHTLQVKKKEKKCPSAGSCLHFWFEEKDAHTKTLPGAFVNTVLGFFGIVGKGAGGWQCSHFLTEKLK